MNIDAENSFEIHESWLDEVHEKLKEYGSSVEQFSAHHNLDYLSVFWFFKGNPVINTQFESICLILGLDCYKIQEARL